MKSLLLPLNEFIARFDIFTEVTNLKNTTLGLLDNNTQPSDLYSSYSILVKRKTFQIQTGHSTFNNAPST